MVFNIIKKSTVTHLCLGIAYLTSGLILNLIQAILYFGLRPLNKTLYRKVNYYLAYSFYSQLVFMASQWSGSKLSIYVEQSEYEKFGKEHAIVIVNHSYEIDWLMGWKLAESVGVLGNCKAFVKKAIQYVPPIGWMWKFSEFVFLERSFDKDKDIIKKQISEICDYPDPVWVLLTPEGTRFTREKHEASLKFAKEKNLPLLKHHLLPRTRGFTTALENIRGKIPALYNMQLAFEKDSKVLPTMTSLLYGNSVHGHMFIKRYPLEEIPTDESEAAKWLQDLYVVKDKMQESFMNTGSFFHQSGVKSVEPLQTHSQMYTVLNIIFWITVILVPLFYYFFGLLRDGEILSLSIGCGVLAIFYFLLQKSIGMSKISQASSYGTSAK